MESLSDAFGRASFADKETTPPVMVALDLEGASHRGGIREVGAVVVGGDDGATFCDVVTQRGRDIGLAPRDAARTWASVGPRFWRWLEDVSEGKAVLLVGHNFCKFDLQLLREDTKLHCPEWPKKHVAWADTLEASRSVFPNLKRRDLHSVYLYVYGGVPDPAGAHTALADARACAALCDHPLVHERLMSTPQRFV